MTQGHPSPLAIASAHIPFSFQSGDASVCYRDDSRVSRITAAADTDVQDEPDEALDNLLAQYEQQAEADKRRVTDTAAKPKPTSQMSMKDLRETGLAQPISSDTKCGITYTLIQQQAFILMYCTKHSGHCMCASQEHSVASQGDHMTPHFPIATKPLLVLYQ